MTGEFYQWTVLAVFLVGFFIICNDTFGYFTNSNAVEKACAVIIAFFIGLAWQPLLMIFLIFIVLVVLAKAFESLPSLVDLLDKAEQKQKAKLKEAKK